MSAESSTTAFARRPSELTGRAVLVCLVFFFAVVAVVNAVMIRAAVSTFGGVETENSYQAGLAFAEEIAAARAQDALRWRVEAKVSADGRATRIDLTVRDAGNAPLAGLEASGRLVHPTDKRADHVVSFAEHAPGELYGTTAAVSGQWILIIDLSRAGTRLFQSRNRIFLR
jgi:nitrogen fixation protein FixH